MTYPTASDYRERGRLLRMRGGPCPKPTPVVPGKKFDWRSEAVRQGWFDEDAYIRTNQHNQPKE